MRIFVSKKEMEQLGFSRTRLEATGDAVKRTEEAIDKLFKCNEINENNLLLHAKEELDRYDVLYKKIDEIRCPLGTDVAELAAHGIEQNMNIAGIRSDLTVIQTNLAAILSIAEGRKSVWREISLFIGSLGILAGVIFGIIRLIT